VSVSVRETEREGGREGGRESGEGGVMREIYISTVYIGKKERAQTTGMSLYCVCI
jgi:hypothetical protein